MSDTKAKAARAATSSEIREREKRIVEFLQWAESVKAGRGEIRVPQEKRALIVEAAREIARLSYAIGVALDALELGQTAVAEIERIKEAA